MPGLNLRAIVSQSLWKSNHIPSFFDPGIFFFAKVLFGVDISDVLPIDTISFVPDRIFLFLHGADDMTIPVENSRLLLSKANPNSTLVIFPHAGHVQTYKTNPLLYRQEVFGFLEKNFLKK